jgi:hypothetical protein
VKTVSFTASDELKKLVASFKKAAVATPVASRTIVQASAQAIKADARRRITGLKHAPAYPFSITYDSQLTPTGATAEIGPDKDKRQGALGNILEFGTVKNAPRPHIGPAADAEEPRFAKAAEELVVKALGL